MSSPFLVVAATLSERFNKCRNFFAMQRSACELMPVASFSLLNPGVGLAKAGRGQRHLPQSFERSEALGFFS